MEQILERDRYLDENSIHSVNILKGNVGSIVAGFSTGVGYIKEFSESLAKVFGYKPSEFETI